MTSLPLQQLDSSVFPLNSIKKFSWVLGIPAEELRIVAVDAQKCYRPFPKKTGKKERIIHNPIDPLKSIQSKINKRILQAYDFPDFIIGGIKGRGLEDHLFLHVQKPIVVTLDIKNCFPSISNRAVYRVFLKNLGADSETARIATMLTTFNGYLPLGAPTSTLLANFVLLPQLFEIKKIIEKAGFELTQFIDDSAISGAHLPKTLISDICKVFSRAGLGMSRKKIQVMPHSRSQQVTKRIVNQFPGLTKREINRIRSAINQLDKLSKGTAEYTKLYNSVKGRIASIKKYHPQKAARFLTAIK